MGGQWEEQTEKERNERRGSGPKGSCGELQSCVASAETDGGVLTTKRGRLPNAFTYGLNKETLTHLQL